MIDISPEQAYQMDPSELASKFSKEYCHYFGDINPFDHGGYFYNTLNWEKDGYAEIIIFEQFEDETWLFSGIIHKIDDPKEVQSSLRILGLENEIPDDLTIHHFIEAAKAHSGYESDLSLGCWREDESGDEGEMKSWELVIDWLNNQMYV